MGTTRSSTKPLTQENPKLGAGFIIHPAVDTTNLKVELCTINPAAARHMGLHPVEKCIINQAALCIQNQAAVAGRIMHLVAVQGTVHQAAAQGTVNQAAVQHSTKQATEKHTINRAAGQHTMKRVAAKQEAAVMFIRNLATQCIMAAVWCIISQVVRCTTKAVSKCTVLTSLAQLPAIIVQVLRVQVPAIIVQVRLVQVPAIIVRVLLVQVIAILAQV